MSGLKAFESIRGTISGESTLSGTLSVATGQDYDIYSGEYEIIPDVEDEQTLETAIYPLLKPSKYAVLRAVRCEKKPRNVGNSSIIPALLLYTYSYTKESLLVVSDALTGVPLRGGFFFVIGKNYKLFYFFYFVF